MKYQLRAGLAVLAVYSGIASILAQIPAAVMSVALDLIGRAAQGECRHAARGEYRQIGALAQLQQLAHPITDAIAAAPQPAWLLYRSSSSILGTTIICVSFGGRSTSSQIACDNILTRCSAKSSVAYLLGGREEVESDVDAR